MKSFTLQAQVRCLGYQLFPQHKLFIPEAYKKGTKEKFSYLVVICHPQWDDRIRVVSKIFPPDDLIVYFPL